MLECSWEKITEYGGGDADCTFRLARVLLPIVASDDRQMACYDLVHLPATRNFGNIVEPQGLLIDKDQFAVFGEELVDDIEVTQRTLLQDVPAEVRRRHADKGLKFTRPEFVKDILFSPEGFGLTPQVWTKGTKNLPPEQREPSVSIKDHLPFFSDHPWVADYIECKRRIQMNSSFVGLEEDPKKGGAPSGFYQYMVPSPWVTNSRTLVEIHPSFILHRTNTGRTASADPNAQNIPKRAALAKPYRKSFVAPPGYTVVEADLSQAELRIAAIMAGERVMLGIYAR